nr:hypothetical protein [uncultured Pedobacter sp.]
MESKLLSGSICLTDLINQAKAQHSAFTKAESNQKIYANISIWLNPETDKYGNDASIQLNPKKDSGDQKPYIGNAHFIDLKKSQPVTAEDLGYLPKDDDLPF